MTTTGTFRLHFNRHNAAPLVWCVATDDWELSVKSVTVLADELRTVYRPKATADEDDGQPSAWLEVTGVLVVRDGNATIRSMP